VLEAAQAEDLVAQARFAQVTAEGFEQQAYAALLTAMGLSPLETIRIAPLEHRAIPEVDAATAEAIVRDALARRPDVLAAYNGVLASKASVKAAEAQNRPKVFLSATGAYVSGRLGITAVPPIGEQLPTLNISGNQWNGTVLVGATVPIFDGHRRANAIHKAQNDEEKAEATLTQVRLNAMREVVSAQAALRNSIAADRAAASMKGTAQILYDSTLDAYQQGVGTVTASVEAESHLFEANVAEQNAYTSALAAGAKLAVAMGTLEMPSR
jgi:outer membrane protein TolC